MASHDRNALKGGIIFGICLQLASCTGSVLVYWTVFVMLSGLLWPDVFFKGFTLKSGLIHFTVWAVIQFAIVCLVSYQALVFSKGQRLAFLVVFLAGVALMSVWAVLDYIVWPSQAGDLWWLK